MHNDQTNLATEQTLKKEDIKYHVIYGSIALFLCVTLFLVAISLSVISGEFSWQYFLWGLLGFSILWLAISVLIGLLRKAPLIVIGGFIALAVISYLSLRINVIPVHVTDILVVVPITVLITLIFCFGGAFLQYRKIKAKTSLQIMYVCLLLISVVGLIYYSWFLFSESGDVQDFALSPTIEKDAKKDNQLLSQEIYDFQTMTISLNNKESTSNNDIHFSIDPLEKLKEKGLELHNVSPDSLNANTSLDIYLPEDEGRFPVVFINGQTQDEKQGFSYLGEYLAANGYIVLLKTDGKNSINQENESDLYKALVILEVLNELYNENEDLESILFNKVDERIALIGFANGVQPLRLATYLNQEKTLPQNGEVALDYNFDIKTLIELSPDASKDNFYYQLNDIDYIFVNGGYDIYSSYSHNSLFNDISFSEKDYGFKTQIYLYQGNRNYFQNDKLDLNFPGKLYLNKKQLIDAEEQKKITQTIVHASLEASINRRTEFTEVFYGRNLEKLYPYELIVSRFVDSDTLEVANFENSYNLRKLQYPDVNIATTNINNWHFQKEGENTALNITWAKSDEGSKITLLLPDNFSKKVRLSSKSCFVFSLANLGEESLDDIAIQIETKRGLSTLVKLSDLDVLKKPTVKPYKLEFLNNQLNDESVFQTISIPLYLFFSSYDSTPWLDLKNVSLVLGAESSGSVLLDDLGFTR